ncbi:MAG: hypothetical protein AAGH70_05580 [Pseudomonadota bacterium]
MKRFTAAIVFAVLAAPVVAQSLEILPVALDVADGEVLTAALTPGGNPILDPQPADAARPAAIRVAAGRAVPSLILGRIEAGREASFGVERLLSSTVTEIAFDLDDLDARETLRARDAALFRQLVEEGHVDPAPSDLVIRLQTELTRMKCYTGGIDNDWGGGSRGGVTRYFAEVDGQSWPDTEATVALFRAMLIVGEVVCPPEQRRVITGEGGTRGGGNASSGAVRTRTETLPTQAEPAGDVGRKFNPNVTGHGVSR